VKNKFQLTDLMLIGLKRPKFLLKYLNFTIYSAVADSTDEHLIKGFIDEF
tara:strand:- start:176 stop:325 length:150 start_codon:yes stop_codon:yes gene_type:complete